MPPTIKILFIDDDPGGWAEVIADLVLPVQCMFDTRSNDGPTLRWLQANRVVDDYDLAICNVGRETQGLGEEIQFGLLFIEELRKQSRDLPIIVLSGKCPQDPMLLGVLMNELYTVHNVAYVAFKRGASANLHQLRHNFYRAIGYTPGVGPQAGVADLPEAPKLDEETIDKIERLVSGDELEDAINILYNTQRYHNDAIGLSRRFMHILKQERAGTITQAQANAEFAIIGQSILALIHC
jgi:hypothetical protein